jgi:hypothetical protein
LSSHVKPSPYRKPSKLTISVACSTVLAAGAASAAVVLWPGSVAAQQTAGAQAAKAGAGATAGQPRLGRSLTDFEAQNSQAHAVASLRVAERAARARARARAASARAAQQRAAQLAAQRQAAASPTPATPTPATSPTTTTVASGTPQQIAMSMLGSFGWSSSQFSCLDQLWERESGWNATADNTSSGAYGIPQALPGSKMASAGPDWETSATTQIKWGLGYIKGLYGSPCGAWAHEESSGWY